jgi:hypothetical protein
MRNTGCRNGIPFWSRALAEALLAAALSSAGCAASRTQRTAYLEVIRPDQRPPLVGSRAATDSLFGDSQQSQRGDGISENRRDSLEALARRFTPTLVLPNDDAIRVGSRRFQLIPCDPWLLADTLRIDRIDASPYQLRTYVSVPLRDLAPDSLARLVDTASQYLSDPDHLEIWYFDFPGETPRHWWKEYARLRAGPDSARWAAPVVWAHPYLDATGRVVLQYWYFYPFNDYMSDHEGDWEHVNVVLNEDHASIREIHYYFHGRSVRLPQGDYLPEIQNGTHPVLYVGGRAYMISDYPMRLLNGDRNSGSHGNYPYPGEWEAAAALGHTESVSGRNGNPDRTVTFDKFRTVLVPEASRIDYRTHPEVLRDWAPLLMPVRWGFPSGPSLASAIKLTDMGNHAPFGPAFNAGWNRAAPGLAYPGYRVRRIPKVRSYLEDLLQPWYYAYLFRHPRYVNDTRGSLERQELERLGLSPRSGWAERGLGSPILGLHVGSPRGDFANQYETSVGFLLWKNFWIKARFGSLELGGGYQKFETHERGAGSIFVYPVTASITLRGPEGLVRPYLTVGAGPNGWESRQRVPGTDSRLLTSGWGASAIGSIGIEYYLRPRVAFDLGLRYLDIAGPGSGAGFEGDRLRFIALWAGHYVRF